MKRVTILILLLVCLAVLWLGLSAAEWRLGFRILPWNPYDSCGTTKPTELSDTVQVGLYEEFPNPWRLQKLRNVDFPVKLAIAAASREEFMTLQTDILRQYPQVREVYFWPLLSQEEGYYPGNWSDAAAVQRIADESSGTPVLWDLEMPPTGTTPSPGSWLKNRQFLDSWLSGRQEPVHIWRSYPTMGLDPLLLRAAGMHYDPLEYPEVSLHLDLYTNARGPSAQQMSRVLRCGVERYGPRFIPSLGVLNDGEGPDSAFISPETLRRNLELSRNAGVSEVWLFGVNGLNEDYLTVVREALPLERLPAGGR